MGNPVDYFGFPTVLGYPSGSPKTDISASGYPSSVGYPIPMCRPRELRYSDGSIYPVASGRRNLFTL